jgi:hypothetical protein
VACPLATIRPCCHGINCGSWCQFGTRWKGTLSAIHISFPRMTKQSRDVYKAMEAACAYFGCVCADAQSVQGETLTPACTTVPPQLMNTKEREQARETTGRTFLVQSPLPNHLCNRNMNCGGGFASTLLHRLWGSHININRQLAEPNIINKQTKGFTT